MSRWLMEIGALVFNPDGSYNFFFIDLIGNPTILTLFDSIKKKKKGYNIKRGETENDALNYSTYDNFSEKRIRKSLGI